MIHCSSLARDLQIAVYDWRRNVGVIGSVDGVAQVVSMCELKGNGNMGNMCRLFWWLVTGVCVDGNGCMLVDMLKDGGRCGMIW